MLDFGFVFLIAAVMQEAAADASMYAKWTSLLACQLPR